MQTVNKRISKPIFIIGCGRSGTTLLFNILKKHPMLVPTTGAPDGEDHTGWIEHGQCLMSGIGNAVNNPGVMGNHYCLHMDEKDVTPEIRFSMHNYYSNQVLREQTDKRIVNKNPHISNKLRYVRSIFPDSKFLHIIRDCLPVVSSWKKMMKAQKDILLYWPDQDYPCLWILDSPKGRDRETLFKYNDRFFPGGGILRLADYWSVVNRNIPIQLHDIPDQLLTIKFEEIVAEPMTTLSNICDFCGLDNFSEIPVKIYPDTNDKFKGELTDKQCDEILMRTKTTRNLFGYEDDHAEIGRQSSDNEEKINKRIIELPRPFRHDSGFSWIAVIDEHMGIAAGDTEVHPDRSRLKLFEDENELNPPHVLHDIIRNKGKGAFSHWGNMLYFSSSDNSNPNKNCSRYRILS